MGPPKLTYFSLKGAGETIRFILSYANEEFIDERIDFVKDWPKIKPTTPFGKLPVLEVDGKVATQTSAICRYYAKKCGLAGKDDWEDLLIDATVGTFDDMRLAITNSHYETNEESKKKKIELLNRETIPFYMERLEKQIKENDGYFVNGRLTWADLWVVALLDLVNKTMERTLEEKYPLFEALRDKVLAIPSIKAWVAKRPKTDW
nr:PREDICTED: glutathione S-transferase-like isoform X2 [Bemisia tabaci]XP_018896150.1 PREDICTED: glutathione S-transferase-like isoform X2 [Bemisia tabaci]XP_018905240.1 PREDICTED: glutathione S-transferase-like [Bemisia tabaci]